MQSKSKTTALVLCLFLGYLGAHRFYVGRNGTGIAQLLTGGGLGLWQLWDLITILRGKFADAQGNLLTA
jgi:TM2 domain-containing membrane protein YozV